MISSPVPSNVRRRNTEERNIQAEETERTSSIWKLVVAVVITAIALGSGAYWRYRSATRDLRQRLESQLTEYSFFTVYGADPYTLSATTDFSMAIPEGLQLAQRLQILASALSGRRFGNLPIEVIGVEERDGKTIALVNLLETDRNRDLFAEQKRLWDEGKREQADSLYLRMQRASWRTLYFQGSCGGTCTTIMLVQTFLQKGYDGTWLDGVEFYYEGEPISDEWDHIRLSGVKLRQTERGSEPSSP